MRATLTNHTVAHAPVHRRASRSGCSPMRRALARALASATLPRRNELSKRAVVWRAPPCWSAPRRALCSSADEVEEEQKIATHLHAALGDPDLVARVLPHLPRPLVDTDTDTEDGDGSSSTSTSTSSISEKKKRKTRVAVGLSGGVDSAVTAWLLKTAGYDVTCVLMRNWDEAEETGGQCDFEKDQRDAAAVAGHLNLKLKQVDFVKEYWHSVFAPFLKDFNGGNATPNPDLACNRHIKFGALLAHCENNLITDVLATGHYARVVCKSSSKNEKQPIPTLLRGVDDTKDQSYFLASVTGESLKRACFPLGGLTKTQVKQIASGAANLPQQITTRRSSAGICFIGRKQNFGDFIAEYDLGDGGGAQGTREMDYEGTEEDSKQASSASPVRGTFVSVDDGSTVGPHKGLTGYTVGQRARLGGEPVPWYVVGKDASVGRNVAYVAPGADHPALFATSCVVGRCFWVTGEVPDFGSEEFEQSKLTAQTRYGGDAVPCVARVVPYGQLPTIEPTKYGSSAYSDDTGDDTEHQLVEIFFEQPTRALTPGQALVLYLSDSVVGGGVVVYPGRSEHEKVLDY